VNKQLIVDNILNKSEQLEKISKKILCICTFIESHIGYLIYHAFGSYNMIKENIELIFDHNSCMVC